MITILDCEHEIAAAMKGRFSGIFETAWDILDVSRRTINLMLALKRGTPLARGVLAAMAVDGMNCYRGILVLAELALNSEAEKLARSLLETLLAAKFIADPPPAGRFGLPPIPVGSDPSEFMATRWRIHRS
jgi:hypothetical protein